MTWGMSRYRKKGWISAELEQQLEAEQIGIMVFYQNRDSQKFFLMASWKAEPDDLWAESSRFTRFVEGATPTEAIEAFRSQLYGGL